MTTNVFDKADYAKHAAFPFYAYECISYLMKENEMVWKLLKYLTPDAWRKDNLTLEEKAALIYAGQEDTSKYHVFMDSGQPDAVTREDCIIRIAPHALFPDNRVYGTNNLIFEVYSHYKINTLDNYTTRVDVITQQFIEVFNGALLNGLGRIYFDRMGSFTNRGEIGGQIPHKGKWLIFGNKSA